MQDEYNSHQQESQEAYLRKLGKQNACSGILYEPRVYHDQFVFAPGVRTQTHNPDTFRNGEQFPVRILYIAAIMEQGVTQSPPVTPGQGDERLIQRYAMRIKAHDTYYMGSSFVPLPLWHNVRSAAADSISRGTSAWYLDHAFALGQRDTLVINVQLVQTPPNARLVSVSFTGIGRASRRPYQLSSTKRITNTVKVQFSVDDFRNDGGEVIDVTEMSVFVGSDEASSTPSGNVQAARIQVRQTGNGTNRDWALTDPAATNQLVSAGLLGLTTSRAVIHRLPGDGWLWQPGQGVSPELLNIITTRTVQETVNLAMVGHIIVT